MKSFGDIRSLVWAMRDKWNLSIAWWLCLGILLLDASAEGYEEAGDYEEEDEEHFDICANQGKLI